jgi:hypothetical protein
METETQILESAWGTLFRLRGQHEHFCWKHCFEWWQKVRGVELESATLHEWLGWGHLGWRHLGWGH